MPQAQAATTTGGYAPGVPVTFSRGGVGGIGVIEKLMPDGRCQVGAAPGQPKPSGDNIYSQEELGIVPSKP